jgi:hypothetical protein
MKQRINKKKLKTVKEEMADGQWVLSKDIFDHQLNFSPSSHAAHGKKGLYQVLNCFNNIHKVWIWFYTSG